MHAHDPVVLLQEQVRQTHLVPRHSELADEHSGSPVCGSTGHAGASSHTGCPPNLDTGSVTGSSAFRRLICSRGRNAAS